MRSANYWKLFEAQKYDKIHFINMYVYLCKLGYWRYELFASYSKSGLTLSANIALGKLHQTKILLMIRYSG